MVVKSQKWVMLIPGAVLAINTENPCHVQRPFDRGVNTSFLLVEWRNV